MQMLQVMRCFNDAPNQARLHRSVIMPGYHFSSRVDTNHKLDRMRSGNCRFQKCEN